MVIAVRSGRFIKADLNNKNAILSAVYQRKFKCLKRPLTALNVFILMHTIFRKKGAYARIKEFLDAKRLLEEWYTFEDMRQKEALREWCRENGIEIMD